MQMRRIGPLPISLLAVGVFGCGASSSVPEPGAALVRVTLTSATPRPDELRAWAYDDSGRLWDNVRVPGTGPLTGGSAEGLGTILIQPGPLTGALRVHLRGFMAGARIADGVLSIGAADLGRKTVVLSLDVAVPEDADADDVPDVIDDCPSLPNPAQGGCPVLADAGAVDEMDGLDATSLEAGDDTGTIGDGAPGADTSDASPDVGGDRGDDGPGDAATADLKADAGMAADAGIATDADAGMAADADAGAADTGPADGGATDALGTGCDGGTCGKKQGVACAKDAECASGACADGVCCTNACTGPCRSCNQPSTTGVCQPYAKGTDPETNCSNGATCDGAGACGMAPPTSKANGVMCGGATECKSGFCKDGVCCNTACNAPCQNCGTGTCKSVTKAQDVPECSGFLTCNGNGFCI